MWKSPHLMWKKRLINGCNKKTKWWHHKGLISSPCVFQRNIKSIKNCNIVKKTKILIFLFSHFKQSKKFLTFLPTDVHWPLSTTAAVRWLLRFSTIRPYPLKQDLFNIKPSLKLLTAAPQVYLDLQEVTPHCTKLVQLCHRTSCTK